MKYSIRTAANLNSISKDRHVEVHLPPACLLRPIYTPPKQSLFTEINLSSNLPLIKEKEKFTFIF